MSNNSPSKSPKLLTDSSPQSIALVSEIQLQEQQKDEDSCHRPSSFRSELSTEEFLKLKRPGSFRKKPKRSVSFALDFNTLEPQAQYFDSNLCIDDDDVRLCWWSVEELHQTYGDARKAVHAFVQQNVEYIKAFDRLLSECQTFKSMQVLSQSVATKAIVINTPSDVVRGMERYLHPTIVPSRIRHVKTVLRVQKKLLISSTPKESHERILCAKSMHNSRESRALARLWGYGDETQVNVLTHR